MQTHSLSAALRVGIALESDSVPAWQLALMQSVRQSEGARLAVVIVCGSSSLSRRKARRAIQWLHERLYGIYRRIDDGLRRTVPDAMAVRPVAAIIGDAMLVDFSESDARSTSDLASTVRSSGIDLLIALADLKSLPDCADVPRLGVWYFEAGGRQLVPADGSMVGYPEVLRRETSLAGSLCIRAPGSQKDLVAYSTCSAVHTRSHFLTRNEHLWKCSSLVSRTLRYCTDSGSYLASLPQAAKFVPESGPVALAFHLGRYLAWRFRHKLRHRRTAERWILLRGPADWETDISGYAPLTPPPGRFWADPHVVETGADKHVFFEDADAGTGKGHIAVVTCKADGNLTAAVPAVERPYHLSYPFVFAWRGDHFMIPESAENSTIELYRCTGFPDKWEFVHNIMDNVRAFDATLLEHQGRWWMFANVASVPGTSSWDELCIFHAESPLSRNWKPHAANPVISDVRSARPAGRFFREGGHLIRPSQDSSGRYGRALRLNRVLELSESRYREISVGLVEPGRSPAIAAVHSYSRAGSEAFIDAIWRERR